MLHTIISVKRLKDLEYIEQQLTALLLAEKEKRERLQAYQTGVCTSYKQRPDN
jgi:hypothetical protein